MTVEQTFRADRLARLAAIERTHFWFVARRALVQWLVHRAAPSATGVLVDLGCGTAYTLEQFIPHATQPLGFDMRPEGLHARRPSLPPQVGLAQATILQVPLASGSVDIALALDVLEHVDDATALAEIGRILKPSGVLVLTVPAFPFLWSHRDEDAGHLRRYTPASLRHALESADFVVEEMVFYQFWLFPLVVLARWLGKFWRRARDVEEMRLPFINRWLTVLNQAEVASIRRGIRYPWGSSLAVVAIKSPQKAS